MRSLTQALYGVFGVSAALAAVAILIRPQILLSPEVYSPLTAHLLREEAAVFLFVGLMCFWCMRHYDQRRPVHLALLLFTAVFAGIHWVDYLQSHRHLMAPVVNSVPAVLLLLTATDRRPATL